MRHAPRMADLEFVLRIALQRRYRKNFLPLCRGTEQLGNLRLAVNRASFKRTVRREIAAKESRIDNNTFYLARHSQTYHAPIKFLIEPRAASPPRFPSVHPFAKVGVFAFHPDRCGRLEQILFL